MVLRRFDGARKTYASGKWISFCPLNPNCAVFHGVVSHGVAVGWQSGAPLGRVRVGASVSHGVAVGWQWVAPLGRVRVGALESHGLAVGW